MLLSHYGNTLYGYHIRPLFTVRTPIFEEKNKTAEDEVVSKEILIKSAFCYGDDFFRFVRSLIVFYNVFSLYRKSNAYKTQQQLIMSVTYQSGIMFPCEAAKVLFNRQEICSMFEPLIEEIYMEVFNVKRDFSPECRAIAKMMVSAGIYSENYMKLREYNSSIAILLNHGLAASQSQKYYQRAKEETIGSYKLDYISYQRLVLDCYNEEQ